MSYPCGTLFKLCAALVTAAQLAACARFSEISQKPGEATIVHGFESTIQVVPTHSQVNVKSNVLDVDYGLPKTAAEPTPGTTACVPRTTVNDHCVVGLEQLSAHLRAQEQTETNDTQIVSTGPGVMSAVTGGLVGVGTTLTGVGILKMGEGEQAYGAAANAGKLQPESTTTTTINKDRCAGAACVAGPGSGGASTGAIVGGKGDVGGMGQDSVATTGNQDTDAGAYANQLNLSGEGNGLNTGTNGRVGKTPTPQTPTPH